jgi:hypothetical protein
MWNAEDAARAAVRRPELGTERRAGRGSRAAGAGDPRREHPVGAEDVVAEFQQRPVAWLAPDIVRSPGGGGGGAWRVCRVQVSVRIMSKTLATWSEALRTEPPVSAAAVVVGRPGSGGEVPG